MNALVMAPIFSEFRAPNTGPGAWTVHMPAPRAMRAQQSTDTEPYRAPVGHQLALDHWIDLTGRRMAMALSLSAGWDGPLSKSIPKSVAIRAYRLLRMAMDSVPSASAPYIVPCADGSLQFEWHLTDTELELYFDRDGSLSAWVHNRETGNEIEAEGAAARELFFRWAPELREKSDGISMERPSEEVLA